MSNEPINPLAHGGKVWSPSSSPAVFLKSRQPVVGPVLYSIAGASLALIAFGILFGAWNGDIIKITTNSLSLTPNRNPFGKIALVFGIFGGVYTISRWVTYSTKRYLLAFILAMVFNFGLNLIPGAVINSNADNTVDNWLHNTLKISSLNSDDLYKVNGFTLEAKNDAGKTVTIKTKIKDDTVTYTQTQVKN